MYTETGAFSTQSFRSLFKDAICKEAKQNCINKQVLKGFQRYPDVLRKYDKNYNSFKN